MFIIVMLVVANDQSIRKDKKIQLMIWTHVDFELYTYLHSHLVETICIHWFVLDDYWKIPIELQENHIPKT